MLKNLKNVFYSNLQKQNTEFETFSETLEKEIKHSVPVIRNENKITTFPEHIYSDNIGTHPDFINNDNLPNNQYICAIFMDISSSTGLALKYSLSEVQKIKNAIISTGIEVYRRFGIHIHRLQGDAIFALSGHKGLDKSNSLIQALNASSVIQHFNESMLASFFENELGVAPPSIRVGIDFGDDDAVLWAKYGIGEINEVTVTSLHADLSSKLQNKSKKNGILIGENVFSYLQLPDYLVKDMKYIVDGEEKKDYYILDQNGFRYKMKNFNWKNHLKRISHYDYPKPSNSLFSAKNCYIECKIIHNGNIEKYYSGTSVGKGIELEYTLVIQPKVRELISEIQWEVHNFGIEAEEDNCAEPYLVDKAEGKSICTRTTQYNGLHYMKCSFKIGKKWKKLYFSLFVNDNVSSLNCLKMVELENEK